MKALFQLAVKSCFVLGLVNTAFAQGSLTPPGTPAPTMKSLDQISQQITNLSQAVTNQFRQFLALAEPRFPISTFQTNLTVPGSYYLVTNLFSGTNSNDAINIRTNISNITIDLNGFSIISTNPAGGPAPVGVRISEGTNIVVRNGQIIGFDRAIRAEGLYYGVVVEGLHIQGCRRSGIEGNGFPTSTMTVRNCVVEGIDGTGEGTNVTVDGMSFLNCMAVVQNCVIRDIVAAGTGVASSINLSFVTNSIVDNNFMSNADVGLKSAGAGTRVYYRNNLTAGIATPFSVAGGEDRGGNF